MRNLVFLSSGSSNDLGNNSQFKHSCTGCSFLSFFSLDLRHCFEIYRTLTYICIVSFD